MEMGLLIGRPRQNNLRINESITLTPRQLTGASMMATTVVKGALDTIHTGYADLTRWMGQHGYNLAGIPRELILEMPTERAGHDLVTEIQFPVCPTPSAPE
jgi:effector-binding domain-containing protein